jgi:hypothetical protein
MGRVVRGRVGFEPTRHVPVALLLRRAGTERGGALQANRAEGSGERPNRRYRYGARAFSSKEGYASRNRETELAPPLSWADVRPPSWFSSEMERRTDAKQQDGLLCVFGTAEMPSIARTARRARAAVGMSGFRVSRKEFWFAYF